jgi:hypothetical protein
MLLRLLEYAEDGCIAIGTKLRVVIEALSGAKAGRFEAHLSGRDGISVRVVPTKQMQSYLLVDAAYMPGSELAHLELLGAGGQDFCQLLLVDEGGEDATVTFDEVLSDLARSEPPVIAFAVVMREGDRSPGRLLLNPDPGDGPVRFRPSEVEVIYGVGETARIPGGARAGRRVTS